MTENEKDTEKNIDNFCENLNEGLKDILSESLNNDNTNNNTESDNKKKEDLQKVFTDFINDLKTTFPEYVERLNNLYENDELKFDEIFTHCSKIYPERFFDILYKNEDIMKDDESNCNFLPNIDFKELWNIDGISSTIKDTIWKYLQVILFTLIKDIDNKSAFGNTAQLFEAINNDHFKDKMEETMKGIQDLLFNNDEEDDEEEHDDEENNNEENEDQENENKKENKGKGKKKKHPFLNPESIHEHLSSLMEGKLGRLATEIAEETAKDLDINLEGSENTDDIMKKLFSNPAKLMDLVKKVGGKLDSKIKAGDIKESELMDEAGNIMKMMKDMPGMKDMGKMFKNMGIPGMGKNSKINTGAFKNRMKKQEAIEKMRKKAQDKVKKMEEERLIQEEYEKKRKEFIGNDTIEEKSIDDLMKQLGLNDTPQTNETNIETKPKKKKKKNKKTDSQDKTTVQEK